MAMIRTRTWQRQLDGSAARCRDCGKLAFWTRKSARQSVARMLPGQRMRFYRCGRWWHFTSQDAGTVARHRERDARRREAS